MQPLMSPVDHEIRHNSYRAEQDDENQALNENTPLLHRFPQNSGAAHNFDHLTAALVGGLLMILLMGVAIAVYLLVLQSKSEHVLPPVDTPLRFVSRSQWDSSGRHPRDESLFLPLETETVIVLQTDGRQCWNTFDCIQLLEQLKVAYDNSLPHNFLVSSDGQVFEGVGWVATSSQFSKYSALVLAFIGNFTVLPPTALQVEGAKRLLTESVSQRHLTHSYVVIAKSVKYKPKYLFETVVKLLQRDAKPSE